jgi:heme-degrading monooxygenase HmoA
MHAGTAGMILEVVTLDIREGQESAFERDFVTAAALIRQSPGHLGHELQRCVEKPNRYVFLARWTSIEAHTEGFRKSALYPEWRRLLHHYYLPTPTVEHYRLINEHPHSSD